MVNTVHITGPDGPIRLLFGTYAVRRFCKIMNCPPTVEGMFPLFVSANNLDAMIALIQCGAEASAAEKNQPFTMTEYQICNLFDQLGSEQEGTTMIHGFIGSVIGKPTAEVGAFLEDLKEKALLAIAESEEEDAGKEQPLPTSLDGSGLANEPSTTA